MRKLREILRLRLHAGLSVRQVRDSLRISIGAIQKVTSAAEQQGIDWSTICTLDDSALAKLIYPKADARVSTRLELPEWTTVHKELRKEGVTKHLLWEEYTQQYRHCCKVSDEAAFCLIQRP
ncbi:IS21 family transposase, partial [Klebsiella quasipneumoniae]